jgi:hypothetical protein
MDSQAILYPEGGNDENYTLPYGVEPIIKYIPKDAVVWCPMDTEESEYVKQIRANGNKVIHSHIDEGKDFFLWEPEEHFDIIITNPCFTDKRLVFERALSFGVPICMLMSLAWLNDSGSKRAFRNTKRNMQLLIFDQRMKFKNQQGIVKDKITFSSGYFCSDFLPKDLIMEELNIPPKFKKGRR